VERLESMRQQQRARRQKEERGERALGEGAADALVRAPVESVRSSLGDQITSLQKGLQETSRRSLSREGKLATAVEDIVQSLTLADLVQTPGAKTVALALDDAFTTRAVRDLKHAFKEELRRDLVTLRDGLQIACGEAQKGLQETLGVSMPLDLQAPDERPIREALGDVVQVQLRYRGELPKRGFLQRLGEGRRMLFAVMMTASLFGGLLTRGRNVRSMLAPFGLVFIVLFIIGVLRTYRSWGREDKERLAKEIEKVREQLQTEAMRLVRDGERERLSRLSEALEQVRRDAMRRVDDFGRQLTQQAAATQARERGAIKDRLRVVDQKTKELDGIRSSLQRAEQDATELTKQTDALLRQSLVEPHGAGT
jgi:hypothetical protein